RELEMETANWKPPCASSRHAELPQQITAGFAQHRIETLQTTVRTRTGPGRHIHWTDSLILEQSLDAEDVIRVADGNATVQPIGAHDNRDAYCRLSRVRTLRLGDQVAFRNSAALKIIAAHAAFTEAGIGGGPAGGNYNGSNAFLKKIEGMIKPRPQHRRGVA